MAALTALEFYSGIGGMHAALKSVRPAAQVLAAFDVNHIANHVYQHNFGQLAKQVNLDGITAKELDHYAADLWMLAPPCQPFTRQGNQLGGQDDRSRSFLNILDQIAAMKLPPKWLLLENVVGFEVSDVHALLTRALIEAGYHVQEFILTPLQYGVPYSRPRYFCLGSKDAPLVPLPPAVQPCQCTPTLLVNLWGSQADQQCLQAAAAQQMGSHVEYVQSISEYLWGTSDQEPQSMDSLSTALPQQQSSMQQGASVADSDADYQVPFAVIERYAEVIDGVTAGSRSCNCFTKAYGKLARGAGSLLATVAPNSVDSRWRLVGGQGSLYYEGYSNVPDSWWDDSEAGQPDATGSQINSQVLGQDRPWPLAGNDTANMQPHYEQPTNTEGDHQAACTKQDLAHAWHKLKLRYFTPMEIAKLHSFPSNFSFPADLSARQCYKLLGNSLSVAVVADLLKYLLASQCDSGGGLSQ